MVIFAIIHRHIIHCHILFFGLCTLSETKYSLICFNFTGTLIQLSFISFLIVHLISHRFVFQFLHLTLQWSIRLLAMYHMRSWKWLIGKLQSEPCKWWHNHTQYPNKTVNVHLWIVCLRVVYQNTRTQWECTLLHITISILTWTEIWLAIDRGRASAIEPQFARLYGLFGGAPLNNHLEIALRHFFNFVGLL
jgi:hypothetical protein